MVDAISGINFLGALDRQEMVGAYRSADVFVFPTTAAEGFGLVRIEAMAAALPVLTTEAGGARDIVRDGIEGFILDYDRPEQTVELLEELRTDPERRLQMGLRGQERQRMLFSEEVFGEALAKVWSDVIEESTS